MQRTLQCQDIIVISDCNEQDTDLSYIKGLLGNIVCTIEEQQEGLNKVAICTSRDIASLEWPVVIHIKPSVYKWLKKSEEGNNLKLLTSYFDTDHSVITSRCMVQYILICQQDDEIQSHGISLTYELDTDKGKIYDLPTLLTGNAQPKPGALEELINYRIA